jgi:hypothetical protein
MNTWGGKRKGAGRKRLNNWSISKAKKLRLQGYTYKEIAGIVKAPSLEAVYDYFKKLGLTTNRQELAKNINNMIKNKFSNQDIAEALNITVYTVKRHRMKIYPPPWQEVLEKGKTSITISHRREYRSINYKGMKYIYAHVLWNISNPNNFVRAGELIHHKNLDSLDDVVGNYEKMTIGEHSTLHKMGKKIKTPNNTT